MAIDRRLFLLSAPGLAFAHGDQKHGDKPGQPPKREQQAWGIAGLAKDVKRTIDIRMGDDMRFRPGSLRVKRGETLSLRVHNEGKLMHEFVIGTEAALVEHARLMEKFPDMAHDEPWMAHVPPGQTGELVWQFNRSGRFGFACLIAGHFSAGMRGDLFVE